jgi:hypothetical protein
MRACAAVLLGISLAASPLLARAAGETGKEDTPAVPASAAAALPDKPAPVKPEASAIESEVNDLRSLVEEQRAELEEQRAALKAQQLKMEALEEKLSASSPSSPAAASVASAVTAAPEPSAAITSTAAISATPAVSSAAIGTPTKTALASMSAQGKEGESPLYFKIGAAEFYPLGFMDATGFFRTSNTGTGIGTGFNGVPFANTAAGRLSEYHFSAQNSRLGLRTHAKFGPADVTGYLEADFLGLTPPNVYDTSNSDTLRMRLYWVDAKTGPFEVLAGQSWSLLTPNRNGLSALPGDLFYGQEMDTNYLLGLTWARQAGVRFLVHPTNYWVFGVSLENAEQTLPSGVTLPPGTSAIVSQFDNNSGAINGAQAAANTAVPNLHPDIIAKTAFDFGPMGHHVHFDFAGVFRSFKEINLITSPASNFTGANTMYNTIHGGGFEGGMNVELFKNFRFIGTAFWSSGGGRYIASTAGPDVIIRPDGNLSGVKAGSFIGGFEWQATPKFLLYGYGSGAYFGRDTGQVVTTPAPTSGVGTCTITNFYGYGNTPGTSVATGSAVCPAATGTATGNANRFMYEPTIGVVETLWRNPSYGDLKLITQYSYVSRAPWFTTSPASASILPTAHNSMVYIDLRYDLP